MQITFFFYDGMTALDAIGPHEILTRLPGVVVNRVALRAGDVATCSGVKLSAEYSLAEVTQTDVLVVPGSGNAATLQDDSEVMEWLRKIHQTTQLTTSVCTGSLILGAAGLLRNVQATSHWAVIDRLTSYGAIPCHQRVVESGKIITAAGVSAGIDMGLQLAAKLSGEEVAKTLQLILEYDPKPPFDMGSPDKADAATLAIIRQRLASQSAT